MGSSIPTPADVVRDIQFEWSTCTACHLHKYRVTTVRGAGPSAPEVVFVLDRLDLEDLPGGSLESGPQKYVLDELLDNLGLQLAQVWITSVTACPTCPVHEEPGGMPRELAAPAKDNSLRSCRPRVHAEIHALAPELVVACGPSALRSLYITKPPAHAEVLGSLLEIDIQGTHFAYPVPVLVLHSMLTLARTPKKPDPAGVWQKTNASLRTGLMAVGELLSMRAS
jgi:uracil-DNA glycosylase